MQIQSAINVHQLMESLNANSKYSIGESSLNTKHLNENFNRMVHGQTEANARSRARNEGQLTLGRNIDFKV